MKQYSSVVAKDLSFTYAKRYIEDNKGYTFISRPEWKGIHFISKQGEWCIYTKNGEVIVDLPLEAVQMPVIPPDIRPMIQLDGGRFATSDLNDL